MGCTRRATVGDERFLAQCLHWECCCWAWPWVGDRHHPCSAGQRYSPCQGRAAAQFGRTRFPPFPFPSLFPHSIPQRPRGSWPKRVTQTQPGQPCHSPGRCSVRARPGSSGTVCVSEDHHELLSFPWAGGAGRRMRWAAGSSSPLVCNTAGGAQHCTPGQGLAREQNVFAHSVQSGLAQPDSPWKTHPESPGTPHGWGAGERWAAKGPTPGEMLCLAQHSILGRIVFSYRILQKKRLLEP